ncbi:MAG: orotidine-5'-phosphate decarboxylase [Chloroflexi bacterium]|jgi:orotidine-5'-phosphate decarboxylase|nr:orotidine-5'-phosphate decarboxylase [Chloroflexota bacterium]MBT4073181.1 orotidine-5'-phosphate decarboxylase [Chloroflexota bacterium]MBT6680448.1 orotidine-5'-phosphate decarboxylase [Chloroflexota bacterium]
MTGWVEKLDTVARTRNSLVCVGLDPDPRRMAVADVAEFNNAIVDATGDLVCAYKPQLAFYEALGLDGLRALEKTISHIKDVAPDVVLIGDCKRGDIGSTATAYAKAMFDVWDFDTVTLHPYLGLESVEPFIEDPDRGAIIVCRTSNPGAAELQDLKLAGDSGEGKLYEHTARLTAEWNTRGNLGIVVGATYPGEMTELRAQHPDMPFLIPGVGAQGGDVEAATQAGVNSDGRGVMISSSRGIIYASEDASDFADAARRAASTLRDEINEARG